MSRKIKGKLPCSYVAEPARFAPQSPAPKPDDLLDVYCKFYVKQSRTETHFWFRPLERIVETAGPQTTVQVTKRPGQRVYSGGSAGGNCIASVRTTRFV